MNADELLQFVTEHEIGVAKGTDPEMIKDLNTHFMGECTEVGMYLAMSRQADREGYPEIAEAFKRYAWEEAEHASKFAELLGDMVCATLGAFFGCSLTLCYITTDGANPLFCHNCQLF